MEIKKIERPNLVAEVKSQMTKLIQLGAWKEGEKLASENQLAKEFNVSRVVIREALQSLRSQNMIITRQGLGSFVSNPNNFAYTPEEGVLDLSEEDLSFLFDIRWVIERNAMDLIVSQSHAGILDSVELALDRMKQNLNSVQEYTLADLDFHCSVVQASGNHLLQKTMSGIRDEFYYTLYEMNKLRDSAQYGIDTHEKIYSFLKNNNAEGAKALLRKSFDYNLVRYASLFKK